MLMIAVVCHTQHMLRNIFWGFSRAANSIWSCIEVTGLISKLIFCNISIFECLSQILREIISLIIRILFYSQSNRIYLLPTLITRDIFLNHAEPHRGLNILSSRLFCCVVSTNAKSLSSLLSDDDAVCCWRRLLSLGYFCRPAVKLSIFQSAMRTQHLFNRCFACDLVIVGNYPETRRSGSCCD